MVDLRETQTDWYWVYSSVVQTADPWAVRMVDHWAVQMVDSLVVQMVDP